LEYLQILFSELQYISFLTHICHLSCRRNYLRCFWGSRWWDAICVVDRRSRCFGQNSCCLIQFCQLCKCAIILLQ